KNMFTTGQSDAFAVGLADLPSGDLFLDLYEGNCSPRVDYRSDLWHQVRTPGKLTLGATFHHYFAGAVAQEEVAIEGGRLHLTATLKGPAGKPLEWMEVHIS
ncbi:MAG TPA: hypothetical protein VII48_13440, partial [Rhizomicrobium sp.]